MTGKARNTYNSLVDLWIRDLSGLCDLTLTYDVLGWELVLDKFLDPENEAIKNKVIQNVSFERLPKAVSLLTSWRRFMKAINTRRTKQKSKQLQ